MVTKTRESERTPSCRLRMIHSSCLSWSRRAAIENVPICWALAGLTKSNTLKVSSSPFAAPAKLLSAGGYNSMKKLTIAFFEVIAPVWKIWPRH